MSPRPSMDDLILAAIQGPTLEEKRVRLELLERLALAAFRSDVSYCIEIAKASWRAKDKQSAELREAATCEAAPVVAALPVVKIRAVEIPESRKDRQRRWGRESMRRARAKERAKKAANAPAEREAALARAAAFAASRGL